MLHHRGWQFGNRRQRRQRARHSQNDLAQRRIVENPAARSIALDRAPLAPGGQLARQTHAGGIEGVQSLDTQPRLLRFCRQAMRLSQRGELFREPAAAVEFVQLLLEL